MDAKTLIESIDEIIKGGKYRGGALYIFEEEMKCFEEEMKCDDLSDEDKSELAELVDFFASLDSKSINDFPSKKGRIKELLLKSPTIVKHLMDDSQRE